MRVPLFLCTPWAALFAVPSLMSRSVSFVGVIGGLPFFLRTAAQVDTLLCPLFSLRFFFPPLAPLGPFNPMFPRTLEKFKF